MMIIFIIILGVSVGSSYLIREFLLIEKEKELSKVGDEIAGFINTSFEEKVPIDIIRAQLILSDELTKVRIIILDRNRNILALSRIPSGRTRNNHDMRQPRQERERSPQNRSMMMQRNHQPGHMEKPPYDDELNIFSKNPKNSDNLTRPERVDKILDEVYQGKIVRERFYHPIYEESVLMVAMPLSDKIGGVLILSTAISGVEGFLYSIYYYIFAVGCVALLISWLLVHYFSEKLVHPLLLMKETAAAIAKGDYSRKVEINGQDEVAELGISLNSLSQDLEIFVEKMNRYEKLRRDFVANVSHELRTPLTIIGGYNEAMLDGTISDEETTQRYRKIIKDETERLGRLIKDLLDISRLQAKQDKLEEIIPLDKLIAGVVEKINIKAQAKNITIDFHGEEVFVQGNGDRLEQLVLILADNAVKYTPENGVINISSTKTSEKTVCFSIKDNGCGIPAEDLPCVLERFYKVDKSHSKKEHGTGLGLAIAKEIIELHEAKFFISSQLNVGTEIKICFPNKCQENSH